LQWVLPERLVTGMIPFISFHAPLKPGEALGPGTAFWFPPLTPGPFSGPPERLSQVIRVLRASRYPAQRHRDAARAAAIPSAVLLAFVDALEAAGWSFERFLTRESLLRFQQAAREAVRIGAWSVGMSASAVLPLLRPALFRLLLSLASRVAPFDLEAYLRVHFTKVSAQMRLMLRTYVELGRKASLPVQQLQARLATLEAQPPRLE
jgi:2-dehydropantoate 2-reductase